MSALKSKFSRGIQVGGVVVGVVLGLLAYFALRGSWTAHGVGSNVVAAGAMVVSGALHFLARALSPARSTIAGQRALRQSAVMGTALVLTGLAQLVPGPLAYFLIALALIGFVSWILGYPKRLFSAV